jgi:sigma-B regulation protein RsbU (phosphoserine phosphatase)
VRLQDGDTFLFFTDGIYEAANPAGQEFGLNRMQEVLREHMHAPTAHLLEELRKRMLGFMGDAPLADDICVVTVTVTSKPLPEPQP